MLEKRKIFKAGVIGVGNIGSLQDEKKRIGGVFTHIGAYRINSNFIVSAISDVNSTRLEKAGRFWNIKRRYLNYLDMLQKEKLDVISVCTPDNTHYDVAMSILKSPNNLKVIFIEKPLTGEINEAKELAAMAKERNIHIVINYHRKFEKEHKRISKMIKGGRFGKIVSGTGFYVKGIKHIGSTMINTLRFLISDIDRVLAIEATAKGTFGKDDPSLDFVLFFNKNEKVIIQSADKYGYQYSLFEIDLIFEKGRVRIIENGDFIEIYRVRKYSHYKGFKELYFKQRIKTNMTNALKYGTDYIEKLIKCQRHTINTPEESIRDMYVIKKIIESKRKKYLLIKL